MEGETPVLETFVAEAGVPYRLNAKQSSRPFALIGLIVVTWGAGVLFDAIAAPVPRKCF